MPKYKGACADIPTFDYAVCTTFIASCDAGESNLGRVMTVSNIRHYPQRCCPPICNCVLCCFHNKRDVTRFIFIYLIIKLFNCTLRFVKEKILCDHKSSFLRKISQILSTFYGL